MKQKRYLGLELSGAKNSKTTLAVLEYFPKEKKVFLLDVHQGIGADSDHDSDEVLVETIKDHAEGATDFKIGVNVPLTLPPCITCTRKTCPLPKNCTVPEVKWMRNFLSKSKNKNSFITPYTQRPIELWIKQEILSKIPKKMRFDLDETLGGSKAPLTARMHFLKLHLQKISFQEVLPKLTVSLLMQKLKLNARTISQYRQLEDGAYARQAILEKMSDHLNVFIYDRDMKKLTQHLGAFDAFLCAYTILLCDLNECVAPPKNFPQPGVGKNSTGWIAYPNELKSIARLNDDDTEEVED